MNGEREGLEPAAELGPVEQARGIYGNYLEGLNQDPKTVGEINKAMDGEKSKGEAAEKYAQISADQGYPVMVVGFLEQTDLPEGRRFEILAQAEGVAFSNASNTARAYGKAVEKNPRDGFAMACKIVAVVEGGRCRQRHEVFGQAARALR